MIVNQFTCFGAMKRLKQYNPQNGSGFACDGHKLVLSLSFLTDSSLVLCPASVVVTTGSMRRYLQPKWVAQVVQLLQDGKSICVSRHSLKSMEVIPGDQSLYNESWTGL